jgi:hypothetical protein
MRNAILGSMLLITGMLTMIPVAAHAGETNAAQRLEGLKQIRQQFIESGMYALQQERACVQAAPTMEALQACDQASRQMMERMRAQQNASRDSMNIGRQQDKDRK